jgi:hypothetical protein
MLKNEHCSHHPKRVVMGVVAERNCELASPDARLCDNSLCEARVPFSATAASVNKALLQPRRTVGRMQRTDRA